MDKINTGSLMITSIALLAIGAWFSWRYWFESPPFKKLKTFYAKLFRITSSAGIASFFLAGILGLNGVRNAGFLAISALVVAVLGGIFENVCNSIVKKNSIKKNTKVIDAIKMRTVFISCERVDNHYSSRLISFLEQNDCIVLHSPRNPLDGLDEKWETWYENGLIESLESCDVFLMIITDSWESSTWMAEEARTAYQLFENDMISRYLYIDLRSSKNASKAMEAYMICEIPMDFDCILGEVMPQRHSK